MHCPCFSVKEVCLLLMICEGPELITLRSVVVDDYYLGRYDAPDFRNMWELIDRKLTTGRLMR
jgi:hypothetical protein